MFGFLDKFFNRLDGIKITPLFGTTYFLVVVFLRYLIESLAGLGINGGFLPVSSILHYALWYGLEFAGAAAIMAFFSGKKIIFCLKIIVLFSPFILIPVIFPFIIGEPATLSIHYIVVSNFHSLLESGINFFADPGFSISLRLQILVALVSLGVFIYWSTRNWLKTFLSVVISYILLILIGSLPSFVVIFQNFGNLYPQAFFWDLFFNHFGEILIGKGLIGSISGSSINIWMNLILSGIIYPFFILIVGIGLFIHNNKLFVSVLKNIRPRKGFDFFINFLLGMALGTYLFGGLPQINFLNFISFVNVFIVAVLFYGATSFFDDVYDQEIDLISHPQRPLITGQINKKDSLYIAGVLAFLSLTGAIIVGLYLFIPVLFSIILAFIYSFSPIRLKKLFIVGNFLIVLAFLSFFLGGFFTLFPEKSLGSISLGIIISYILLMMALVAIKDISDYEGDKKGGIKTISVVMGLYNSKIAIGTVLALVIISLPLFLNNWNFGWFEFLSLIFAPIIFHLVTRKEFSEKKVYFAGILFFIIAGITFLFIR